MNKLTLDNLDIIGYSVAGEESVVALPTLDVCFDVGKAPDQILSVNHVLLTHGHMDHTAGIAYYCSQRDFREMAPGTVLLPAPLAPVLEKLLDCWGILDGSRPPANIVPLQPGMEFQIRRNLFAYSFATNHSPHSLGYTIIERRQKLKPEYLELTGPQIAELKKNGTEITYTLDIPLVTYLGDTMAGDFHQLACVQNSKILIAECTFFEQDHHSRARAGKHYHFDELSQAISQWNNEHILFTHLSRRTDLAFALRKVREILPPEITHKIRFLMNRPRRNKKENSLSQNKTS
jgi:ribonuclease Z